MNNRRTLLDRVELRIKKRKDNVFVLSDFDDLIREYDYDQVLRALRILVKKELLIKIGRGIYAKTRKFSDGFIVPVGTIGNLAAEALNKYGVKTGQSHYWNANLAGTSTQVPTGRVVVVNKRVRRKIGFNGYEVVFEHLKN